MNTYPMYDEGYQRRVTVIREYLAGFANLQIIGRNGMHRYNNMDHSMLTGLLAVKNLCGENHDLWSVKPCYQCHRSKITALYVHEAVAGKECTPCHQVAAGSHQSDKTLFAVKDKSAKLCQECHESQAAPKSVHPVIESDGCIGCHAPHNSPLKRLLRFEVPRLCFECHDRGLVEQKETAKGTGFRDGVQNLHYLHAGEKNGLPCLACHDVHASSQLHLMRTNGSVGKDAVTIVYSATDKGGNCAVSCHDALGYERK